MCQAFHHACRPVDLLNECNRILKTNGQIIMIGEDYIDYFKLIKRFFSKIIYEGFITFDFQKLFPINYAQGDHYYFYKDYKINNRKVIYILKKYLELRLLAGFNEGFYI